MITAENILQHEFIGLNTKFQQSTNPQLIGLNGTIINETKSMFALKPKKESNQFQNPITNGI